MTRSPQTEDRSRLKRSMSPDEGEIVDDPKRHRPHPSPPTGPRNQRHGDQRRHKVVYEGGGRGRDWNGYSNYRGRGYRDQHARGYEQVRQPSWRGDHTNMSKRYSSQYSSERSRQRSASPSRSSPSRSPENHTVPAHTSSSKQTRQSSLAVTTLIEEYVLQPSLLMDSAVDEPILETPVVDE